MIGRDASPLDVVTDVVSAALVLWIVVALGRADLTERGLLRRLGLGVLAGFGVRPVGSVLLDEKLGLHVALGRSEHFGGQVGPAAFSRPENVVHQDYVYLKELQPRVEVELVRLALGGDGPVELMRDGDYVVDFAV